MTICPLFLLSYLCVLCSQGLGKTVQVVAMLCHMRRVYCRGPYLVVVPLSTLPHWRREFNTWTDLNCIAFQGSKVDRDLLRAYEWHYRDADGNEIAKDRSYKFEVCLATYESVLLEPTNLGKIQWKALIADEAHRLKNRQSKLFQTLNDFRCEFRVLLTGVRHHTCSHCRHTAPHRFAVALL